MSSSEENNNNKPKEEEGKAKRDVESQEEDEERSSAVVKVTPEMAASLALMTEKESDDNMVKAKAKAASAASTTSAASAGAEGSPTNNNNQQQQLQYEEDQMAKGRYRHIASVSADCDQKPAATTVQPGAYCQAPGVKTERRDSLHYAAVDGHLDSAAAARPSTAAAASTTSCTTNNGGTVRTDSNNSSGDTSDGNGAGSNNILLETEGMRESALRLMEERKFIVNSLTGMLDDDSEQQQEQQERKAKDVEEGNNNSNKDNEKEQGRETEGQTNIQPRSASTTSSNTSDYNAKQRVASIRSNGTESLPGSYHFPANSMDDSNKSQSNSKPFTTTSTTSTNNMQQLNSSDTTPTTSSGTTTTTTTGGGGGGGGLITDAQLREISYSQLPIAAKLVVEETESEMFQRISEMYLDGSLASSHASRSSHHSRYSRRSSHHSLHSCHSHHSTLPLAELVTTNSSGPFASGKRWMILLIIAILVLLGILIGVVVGLTSTNSSSNDSSDREQDEISLPIPQQQPTDAPIVLNSTVTTPPPLDNSAATMVPPTAPPALFIPSQCILLNYPEVVAFNETQRQDDPVIANAPETICYDRLPYQGWSSHCPPQPRGSGATNLVAQSQLWYVGQQADTTSTIIALVNAGQIKRDFCKGDFTNEMNHIMFPYDNRMVQIPNISGQTIVDLLEEGIEQLYVDYLDGLNGAGGYPYTAGLRFDLNMTATVGNRLSNLQVHSYQHQHFLEEDNDNTAPHHHSDHFVWITLDRTANYTLVTNSWMADGGDGYTILGQAYIDNDGFDTGVITRDVFQQYSQQYLDHVLLDPPITEYSTQNYIHDTKLFNITR